MVKRRSWCGAARGVTALLLLAAVSCVSARPAAAYELLVDSTDIDGSPFGLYDGTADVTIGFNGGDLGSFTVVGNASESGGLAHLANPGVHNTRFNLDVTSLIGPPFVQDGHGGNAVSARFITPALNDDEFIVISLDSGLDQVAGGELFTVGVLKLGPATAPLFLRAPGYYFLQVYASTAQTLTDTQAFSVSGFIPGPVVLRIRFDDSTNLVSSEVSLDGGTTFQSPFPARPYFISSSTAYGVLGGGRLTAPPEGPFGSASCSDGLDNDDDGFVDGADSNCAPPLEGPQGAPSCSDGLDNDGDQLVDAADPGCQVTTLPEICNGIDDDGNGQVDEGFPDSDGDGFANCVDQDRDNDGIEDGVDNCPATPNSDQNDADNDGIGDACDANTTPITNPPTALDIAVDGQFGPPMSEWMDVTPASFLGGQSKVYSSTDPGQDAIYLMYDFAWSTTPLAVGDEAGDVAFQVGGTFFDVFFIQGGPNTGFGPWPATSEGGLNDQVRIVVNGLPFDNSAGCIKGAVDFNTTSPNFPGIGHNLFELQVKLTGAPGGCYSPEPAFWSAVLPGVQPIVHSRDARSTGSTDNFQISAAFVDIAANGSTSVTALIEGPAGDPTCSDGLDNDGDGKIDGADPDCVYHLCDAGVRGGCRSAVRSLLMLKNKSDDDSDLLLWKWLKGAAADPLDFGNPVAGASTGLCIYTGPTSQPLLAADLGPDPLKWQTVGTTGYKYNDPLGAQSGVHKALFKAGAIGKSKAIVKGKGSILPDPTLGSLPTPIIVQLVNSDSNVCFESVFQAGDVISNTADSLKLKTQ